jgi:membrane-associated phospholipid phosphatase
MTGRTRRKRSKAEKADLEAIRLLEPWLRTRHARIAGAIGNIGDQPPLRALAGAVIATAAVRRDERLMDSGWHMLLAHQIATVFKTIGKDNVDRTRPRRLLAEGEYDMKRGTSRDPGLRSFPSGHTAGAAAMACAVARDYPRNARAAYLSAAAIGLLQIPRRAHFPGDVLAGVLVGLAAESIAAWFRRAAPA